MLKIHILSQVFSNACFDMINHVSTENKYLENLGWSEIQFKKQLLNKSNLALGIFENNILQGFIIGQLITIEKILEYEILLIYVSKDKRKLGYASELLNEIPIILDKKNLKKIYLEVASNNLIAIKLYNKNKYKKKGTRKNYYSIENKKIDAIYFEKKINE